MGPYKLPQYVTQTAHRAHCFYMAILTGFFEFLNRSQNVTDVCTYLYIMLVCQTLTTYISYDVLFIIILKIKKKFVFLEGGLPTNFDKNWGRTIIFPWYISWKYNSRCQVLVENNGETPPPPKNRKKSNFFQRKLVRVFPEKISTFSKFHNFLTRRSRALRKIYVIAMV